MQQFPMKLIIKKTLPQPRKRKSNSVEHSDFRINQEKRNKL